MVLADLETVEDEDEPEAKAMDQDVDGEGKEAGSDKEVDSLDNFRLYVEPKIEFDS